MKVLNRGVRQTTAGSGVNWIATFFAWLAVMIIPCGKTLAHEAWLQPAEYFVSFDDQVKIDAMSGENFAGYRLAYNPVRFSRLEIGHEGVTKEFSGRLGDLPAVQFKPETEGLHIVVYQTTGSNITYQSREQFETFAKKEGVEWILKAHQERKLAPAGFKEAFYRYCKTLVGVGHSAGADQYMNMPYELIALKNPASAQLDQLPLQLRWRGKGEPGFLSVYQRVRGGEVNLETFLIDKAGRVTIPLNPASEYLLNVVKMQAIELVDEGQPVWESHWASLTFSTAGDP